MSDLGWQKHFNGEEDKYNAMCTEARIKYNLPPDPEELVNCEECPAQDICEV